jgi:hypothetical protein
MLQRGTRIVRQIGGFVAAPADRLLRSAAMVELGETPWDGR